MKYNENHVCTMIHPEVVRMARESFPTNEDHIHNLAQFFKLFGDPTRIRILLALSISEMCVCDIAALMSMQHSAISHQLKTLSQAQLVKQKKKGKAVYYSLKDLHVKTMLDQGFKHIQE